MGKEIYNIINGMSEILNVAQMQKLQEVLVNRLSENKVADYMLTSVKLFVITNAMRVTSWTQYRFWLLR